MINLLPIEQKRFLRSDYRQRILVTGCLLFSCLLLISIGILAVLYFSVNTSYKRAEETLAKEQARNVIIAADKLDQEVRLFDQKLSLITKNGTSTAATVAIKSVLDHQTIGVTLQTISYSESSDGLAVINLTGVAETRAKFLIWVEALRADTAFAQVDSPVSNLIKEKWVDFSLSIQVNDK